MAHLNSIGRGNVTQLLGDDIIVPIGRNLLKRVSDLRVNDRIQKTFKDDYRVIGYQNRDSDMVRIITENSTNFVVKDECLLKVLNKEGCLTEKKARDLIAGDIFLCQLGQYEMKTDFVSYDFGRMSSLNNEINAIVALSNFILQNPVQFSVSWLQGYLNGASDMTIIADTLYINQCRLLANSIVALYASIGVQVAIEEEDDEIVNTDIDDLDRRYYIKLSTNNVVLDSAGNKVIVCVDTNAEEWKVNTDVKTIPVKLFKLKFLKAESIIIPSEYGKYLLLSKKTLRYRCWNLVQTSFLQGSNDLALDKFMCEFKNHDAVIEDVVNGLRFSKFISLEKAEDIMGYGVTLESNEGLVGNSFLIEGVDNAFGLIS